MQPRSVYFIVFAILGLLLSCEKGEEKNDDEEQPESYILFENRYYELSSGYYWTGVYDISGNAMTYFLFCSENVDTDDSWPTHFSGIGNGAYIMAYGSLAVDSYPTHDDNLWAAFDNYNFNEVPETMDIGEMGDHIKELKPGIMHVMRDTPPFKIKFVNDDFEIYYEGGLTELDR